MRLRVQIHWQQCKHIKRFSIHTYDQLCLYKHYEMSNNFEITLEKIWSQFPTIHN